MNPQNALAVRKSEYPSPMAKVTEKRADGALVIVVPPDDVADLEVGEFVDVQRANGDKSLPPFFGLWKDQNEESITIEDIKAARREAPSGKKVK